VFLRERGKACGIRRFIIVMEFVGFCNLVGF